VELTCLEVGERGAQDHRSVKIRRATLTSPSEDEELKEIIFFRVACDSEREHAVAIAIDLGRSFE